MKIDTRLIPEGKLISLEEAEQVKDLDLDVPGIRLVSPLKIKADIIKIQDTVDIRINLKSNSIMQCSRCLVETASDIERSFRLDYSVSDEGKIIDIADDIRQEIVLGYPMRPLCKPSCKGLCPHCGSNLNEGQCNCKA